MKKSQTTAGRLVLITGVAGALGSRTASVFRDLGWTVAGIDLAANPHPEAGVDHYIGRLDLTDGAGVSRSIESLVASAGRIDAVANIAGGFAWETIPDGSPETWQKLWSMNVTTTLNVCRASIPLFSPGGGAIVNVSAAATARAGKGMGAYTAAKSAVSRLTEALAEELLPSRIRVNAVLPSILNTAPNRDAMPGADHSAWVQTDELARVIAFLAGPDANAVTGALLPVTGRMPAG